MAEIKISNVSFAYIKGSNVLENINLHIGPGESVGLVGANGVGKSTLLKLLVGLERGYEGSIQIDSMSVKKENLIKIREKTGYVFQDSDSQLFTSNVYDDVAFASKNYGYSRDEVERRTEAALSQMGIEDIKNRPIYTLSGGQKKLASIATILSLTPEIILMDEPSVALDPVNRRKLIDIIKKLNGLKIIATHDLDLILDTCERVVLLAENRIVKDGKTENILTDEQLLRDNGLELPLSLSRL